MDLIFAPPAIPISGHALGAVLIARDTLTAPAGWTVQDSGSVGNWNYGLASHVATASEPSAYQFSIGSEVPYFLWYWEFVGVTGLDAFQGAKAIGAASIDAPSVTSTAARDIVIVLYLAPTGIQIGLPVLTPPASLISSNSTIGGMSSGFCSAAWGSFQMGGPGSVSGVTTATLTPASDALAATIALRGGNNISVAAAATMAAA